MRVASTTVQLQSLASMAHALASSSPLLPMLEIAAEEARSVLQAASVSVSRVELDRGVARTIVNVGELGPDEERWPEDEVYVIAEVGRLGQAVREKRPWTESLDDPHCDPYERELLISLGKGSSLATPILVDGIVWGELYLTRHVGERRFDADVLPYAEVLSAMLGAAVSRSIREETLEGIARRDPLTGLSNRRDLDERADKMFTDRTTRTVTALSVDINGLKQVNDSYGHARGDLLIQSVGHALQDAFGDLSDACIARVGGDEFTVVVADHPLDDLIGRVDRLSDSTRVTEGSTGVSAGLASVRLSGRSTDKPSALFAAADRAQYAAKRSRSRHVVVSRELAGPE